MAMLIVFSGFLAIILVGTALVAVNDAIEAFAGRRMRHGRSERVPSAPARGVRGRSGSRRSETRPAATGRRPMPRDVIVVHAGRVRSAEA